jgi:antitoxin (DNA-binding transcriptional repressor) of toxin-antitoxin stability system
MAEVTIRELTNQAGRVVDRVLAGERVTVVRDGKAVAELRPLGRTPLPAATLLERWRRLPGVDPEALRRDLDVFIDRSL